ncbi:MAG: DUF6468 domain-containing protein [Maricaulaceae bacterium]|jgi:hypothetical protein
MSLFSLVFEGAVAVVLVLVASLCWRLDRRLTALKSGQDGVRRTVVELAEATARAEASVKALRAAGDSAGRELDEKVTRARALADELSFLIANGSEPGAGSGAGRRAGRGRARAPEPVEPARPERRGAGRADAFAELLAESDAPADVEQLRRRLRGVR